MNKLPEIQRGQIDLQCVVFKPPRWEAEMVHVYVDRDADPKLIRSIIRNSIGSKARCHVIIPHLQG